MSARHPPRSIRRAALLLLTAWALLVSQTLGVLHRATHVGWPPAFRTGELHGNVHGDDLHGNLHGNVHGAARRGSSALSVAAAGPVAMADGLARLFGAHDEHGCDAYDQLSHADVLWSACVPWCAIVAVTAQRPPHPAPALAAQAAGYLARGPPQPA